MRARVSEKKQFKFSLNSVDNKQSSRVDKNNQHELKHEFRHVFARAALVLASGMSTLGLPTTRV